MPGFEPILAVEGQLETASGRRVELNRINLGPQDYVLAANTVTIHKTNTFLDGGLGSRVSVETILGGQESDLLLLFADNVRLMTSGNITISSNFKMDFGDSIMLFYVQGSWIELSRTE
jgi:hypothetical protein